MCVMNHPQSTVHSSGWNIRRIPTRFLVIDGDSDDEEEIQKVPPFRPSIQFPFYRTHWCGFPTQIFGKDLSLPAPHTYEKYSSLK